MAMLTLPPVSAYRRLASLSRPMISLLTLTGSMPALSLMVLILYALVIVVNIEHFVQFYEPAVGQPHIFR